ncbi:MAG TPA: UpxY family transcription antiterminator [Phycisphaerae bacterium]|nr:UpxY family transcription antiterminator [Phycisphaerae bacterium]
MSSPSEQCWYALYTRSRFEKEVDKRLGMLGIETYLPLYRARRRWSDRTVQLDLPLFPSYLFVRLKPASPDIYRILDTKGVVRFVSASTGPIEVPREEIEAVKRVLSAKLPVRSLPWLREGQKVQVCAGPLHGLEGIVEKCNGRGHLYISVRAIGQTLVAELDCRDVAPLLQ